MSANIDTSNGRFNIAFTGSRNDVWHRHGQEMAPGMSIGEWKAAAGLGWSTIQTPAYHQLPDGTFQRVAGWVHQTRDDTLQPLGYTSEEGYKAHQAGDLLDFLEQYIGVDDRFALDVAGSLDGGKKVWATATFNGAIDIAGSAHQARLLASTSFDTTQSTWLMGCLTRVVCENTLAGAMGEKNVPVIRYPHSKAFNRELAGKELAELAKGFDVFKQAGDAMALVHFANGEVSAFFKQVLDIDPNAKREEISTRKFNQFTALRDAYHATEREGTEGGTVWTALNAVTRYVDHDRSSRNGDSPDSARFDSSLWGSGQRMKEKAWNLLMPLVRDKVAA